MRHLKMRILIVIFMFFYCINMFLSPVTFAESSQEDYFDVWVTSSYINVFKDFVKDEDSKNMIDMVVAKNEFESAQILMRSSTPFTIHNVHATDLTSGSNKISSSNITYNYVDYTYLGSNSEGLNKITAVRFEKGHYPDPLSNDKIRDVPKDTTQPVWITIYIPIETKAGTYNGSVILSTTAGEFSVDMNIEVYDVTIPDPADGAYSILMWQLIIGSGFGTTTANSHPNDPITRTYKFNRWTPEWWALVDNIATVMKNHRLNVLFVQTVQLLIDGGSYLDETGKYHFNWSKFDEYIEFFINKGVVKSLAGYMMTTAGENVNLIKSDWTKTAISGSEPMNSPISKNWLNQYIPALYEHLIEKDLLDIWFQNLRDEPSSNADKANYSELVSLIRKYAPDMKIGDPHTVRSAGDFLIEQKVNYLIPLLNLYDTNQGLYNKALNDDTVLFTYTCVVPSGSWLNRYIDKPVWQGRSIAWYNYNVGASGYLHWGLMSWYRSITDFANGDTSSIFPDLKNKDKVKTSIRLVALRDGAEDYELLKILENKDIKTAKELAKRIAKSGNTYSRSPEEMINMRSILVRAAAGVPNAIKYIDNIELNVSNIELKPGDNFQIKAVINPDDPFYSSITWKSDNEDVAALFGNGILRGVSLGETYVRVFATDNPEAFAICKVNVVEFIHKEIDSNTTDPQLSQKESDLNSDNIDKTPDKNSGILSLILMISIGISICLTVYVLKSKKKK